MRLLVIGGTSFVGRTIVGDALRRGHQVTTFNRGLTGRDVDGVGALRGDRSTDEGLQQLGGHTFDAVIDPGGLVPAHVLRTARAMAGAAAFYAFVSTTAVYQAWNTAGADESAATWPGVADEDGDAADLAKLGVRKRGCELAVEQTFGPDACMVARAGLIVGPHDNVGQLPWWLTRIAKGGRVVAPGDPARGLQLIDVRDLATFVLDQVEAQAGGIHNVVPDGPNTAMGQLVDGCVQATGSDAAPVWVDEGFLFSQGVQPWAELPLWIPDGPDTAGFWAVSGAGAKAAGLRTRPFGESIRDTWDWLRSGGKVRPAPGTLPFGISGEKEQQVLAAWDSRPAAQRPGTLLYGTDHGASPVSLVSSQTRRDGSWPRAAAARSRIARSRGLGARNNRACASGPSARGRRRSGSTACSIRRPRLRLWPGSSWRSSRIPWPRAACSSCGQIPVPWPRRWPRPRGWCSPGTKDPMDLDSANVVGLVVASAAIQLASWIWLKRAGRMEPTNTEGHPLVAIDATMAVRGDLTELLAALPDFGEEEDGEHGQLVWWGDPVDDLTFFLDDERERLVRGRLRPEEGRILVPVNSQERLARLLKILTSLGAEPEVTEDRRFEPSVDFAWGPVPLAASRPPLEWEKAWMDEQSRS